MKIVSEKKFFFNLFKVHSFSLLFPCFPIPFRASSQLNEVTGLLITPQRCPHPNWNFRIGCYMAKGTLQI